MTDLYAFHKQALRIVGWDQSDETKHPRGNPENAGEFRKKDGPAAPSLPRPPRGVKATDHAPTRAAMKAKGDVYGEYLPKGKYDEGDPRNDPEFEKIHNQKAAKTDQYVVPGTDDMIEAVVAKLRKDGAPEKTVDAFRAKCARAKQDRARKIGGSTEELWDFAKDDKNGSNPYVEERRVIHQGILDHLENKAKALGVPKQGKCLIMSGPSGAGKSTFLERYAANSRREDAAPENERTDVHLVPDPENPGKFIPDNYIVINPDDFKDYLPTEASRYPGLNKNEMAGITHEESSYLAKAAVRRLMSQGYNVILDVTLANDKKAIEQYVDPYADKYHYQAFLVDGTMQNSYNNAGIRYKKPDKYTGERTYGGRFVSMGLVAGQKATDPRFRSINGQSFQRFRSDPRIGPAKVYDPETGRLMDADEWMPRDQVRAAALAGMLRAQGGKNMGHQTTEITEKIKAYRAGSLSESALVHYLTEQARYEEPIQDVSLLHPNRYYETEMGSPYTAGGWDEVELAHDTGLLPRAVFNEVANIISKRTHPNA